MNRMSGGLDGDVRGGTIAITATDVADAVRIVPNGIPAPVPEIDVAYLADSIDDEEIVTTPGEGTALSPPRQVELP